MHFIDGEFQIGCFTDKTFRSANNTRASKKEQTSDKHVKESSARMNKAFIVRTASWAKLLHGHGKSLRVWRNFLFCLNLLQPWHKSYFWNVPGLPLPAINWSGRSLTGGKALPRRSRPDASVSVYCDSGCCRVTHRRDDTEPGPGVRAESALFADRRWRVHAAGDGGEVWVEFFLSDPRNVTRGREADSHQRFHREEIKPSVHREKERRRVQQQSEEVRS